MAMENPKPQDPLLWLAHRLLVKSGKCKAMLLRDDRIVRCDEEWEEIVEEEEEEEEKDEEIVKEDVDEKKEEKVEEEKTTTPAKEKTTTEDHRGITLLQARLRGNKARRETLARKQEEQKKKSVTMVKKKGVRRGGKTVLVRVGDIFLEATAFGRGESRQYKLLHNEKTISSIQPLQRIDTTTRKLQEKDSVFVQPEKDGPFKAGIVTRRYARGVCDVKLAQNDTILRRVSPNSMCWMVNDEYVTKSDMLEPWNSNEDNKDTNGPETNNDEEEDQPIIKQRKRKKKKKKKKKKIPTIVTTTTTTTTTTPTKARIQENNNNLEDGAQSPRTVARLRLKVKRERTAALLRRQKDAAVKIQTQVRGNLTRERVKRHRENREKSALVIQTRYRGYQAQKGSKISKRGADMNVPFRALMFECEEDRIIQTLIFTESSRIQAKEIRTHNQSLLQFVRDGKHTAFQKILKEESDRLSVDSVVVVVHEACFPSSVFLTRKTRQFLERSTPCCRNPDLTFRVLMLNDKTRSRCSAFAVSRTAVWEGLAISVRSVLRIESDHTAFLCVFSDDKKTGKTFEISHDSDKISSTTRGPVMLTGSVCHLNMKIVGSKRTTARKAATLLEKHRSSDHALREAQLLHSLFGKDEIVRHVSCDTNWKFGWFLKEYEIRKSSSQQETLKIGDVVEHMRLANSKNSRLQIGDVVSVRYRGGKRYFPGQIKLCREDGTYDVRYEDGDHEKKVKREMIKKEKEDKVVIWSTGTLISHDRRAGTYGLKYDDETLPNVTSVTLSSIRRPIVMSSSDILNLRIGNGVLVRQNGHSDSWSGARVVRVRDDGSCDVALDSGENVSRVPPCLLRPVMMMVSTKKFQVGDDVELNYQGRGKWFAARISVCYRDGTYEVVPDDKSRHHVRQGLIRTLEMPSQQAGNLTLDVGTDVDVRYRGTESWRRAKIEVVRGGDMYDVKYVETGKLETKVRRPLIRKVEARREYAAIKLQSMYRSSASRRRKLDGSGVVLMEKKDNVVVVKDEADAVEKKIKNDDDDNNKTDKKKSSLKRLFDIGDVDGDGVWNMKEANMIQKAMKEDAFTKETWKEALDALNETKGGLSLESVSQLFDGQTDIEISKVCKDVVDVLKLEDELLAKKKKEEEEEEEEKAKKNASSSSEAKYVKDDRVLVRFKGRNKLFVGKIVSVKDGSKYDVSYLDGDSEENVPEEWISKFVQHKVGSYVEARRHGNVYNDFELATVLKYYEDSATYDLVYDADKEKEKGVTSGLIRASTKEKKEEEKNEENNDDDTLKEGDRVEVRYGGKKKWFLAKIASVHENGTFDVNYEDGDKERAVKSEFIRRFVPFKVNQEVEARYHGKKRWFAGKITDVIDDGAKYNITYSDGDKEESVVHRYVRHPKK